MPFRSTVIRHIMRIAKEVAALHRYPFPERSTLWEARLGLNARELECIEALTDGGACHYAPPRATLLPGGVRPDGGVSGIAEIARAARSRPGSAEDFALQALERARRQRSLNAFTAMASEDGIAAQLDELRQDVRASHGPLFGVPIAVKDLMAVKGFLRTGGSGLRPGGPCDRDALAVARLRQAGAVVVGMANLHELAYGITSANPHFGAVANPLGAGFIPGGSSGGSAAAVAAGIVRGAVGTDTAGSIRIPAACCGVVGFKPSYDAVSRRGAMDLGPSLDHVGPIARSVDDAALLFSIMAGQAAQVPQRLARLQGIRIGLPKRYFFEPLASDVRGAVDASIAALKADGAVFKEVDVPGIDRGAALMYVTLCSEATAVHWQRLAEAPGTLGEDVRTRLEIGQLMPALWYVRAQGARARLALDMGAAMAEVDFLLTPTLRATAPRMGADTVDVGGTALPLHAALTSLTLPFNLTGFPAVSLPCGYGDTGMPVGLQIVGGIGDDWRLLAVSKRIEELLDLGSPAG